MSSGPSSPPPPWAQRAIGSQGPFFELETTTPRSTAPRRFHSQKGGAADIGVTAWVRPISPPPFLTDRREGAVLPSRHHGHRLEERRYKSGEFTFILEGASREDRDPVSNQSSSSIHPSSSEHQKSAPTRSEMSRCPDSPSRLWPQSAIDYEKSPFFEADTDTDSDTDTDTIPRMPITPKRFRDRPGKLIEARGNKSISLAKRPPMPPKGQTAVGLTARLEAQRPSSPPPARKNGLIASIFKRKKQMETFHGFVEGEAAHSENKTIINNEPRPTNLGLARIFSYEELIHSTNNFRQELADGGFSRVYLGKLRDERKVAVKVLFEGIPKRMEQFLNEVTVLSRLRHKNLVSLYGCTDPETQKLLLVYEFVPNGTISDHLHRQQPPLTWAVRMQIAIETAEALAYLHSREPPIIHRDVKTSNILLDNEFHVKVADLGMCRLVPWDTSTISTQPQGTLGFRDPESDLYCVLTDKSDVYSFGVVLLELISGQQAVDVNRERNDIYLFNMAFRKISNNELENLVDPKLAYHSDSEIRRMVDLTAELACCCLQQEGNTRPPMEEVLTALKAIRDGVQ